MIEVESDCHTKFLIDSNVLHLERYISKLNVCQTLSLGYFLMVISIITMTIEKVVVVVIVFVIVIVTVVVNVKIVLSSSSLFSAALSDFAVGVEIRNSIDTS